MPDEIYDIIDKKGNKTGTATWTEVHTQGLLHQTAHAILFKDNSFSETLLKKRSPNNAQEAGKYEIAVAGHIISGHTPEETIRREFREELLNNQDIPANTIIKKLTTYLNNDIPNNNEIAHLFIIIHPGPFTIEKEETESIKWINWKDLLKDIKNNPHQYSQYSISAINTYLKHAIQTNR